MWSESWYNLLAWQPSEAERRVSSDCCRSCMKAQTISARRALCIETASSPVLPGETAVSFEKVRFTFCNDVEI